MSGHSVLDQLRRRAPDRMATAYPRSTLRLHAMVTTAGCDRVVGPGYDHHGASRGSWALLQHTLSGSGRLRCGSRHHLLRPGDTMLLRFPDDVRYWAEDNREWCFFWLGLNGREVLRLWREAMRHGPVARLGEHAVLRLATLCETALAGALATPAMASATAYEAATIVCGALMFGERQVPASRAGDGRADPIERAIALCHADAVGEQRLDVRRLAAATGLSRHHFSRRFADATGEPPARYVRRRRLDEATRLLGGTGLPIKAVALRLGFADPNNFARAFRRQFGVSPRGWRQRGGD